MPEILIISGKGGTGKTSITAAFSHLAGEHVVCDLDVDAPDLHLLLQPVIEQTHAFRSGHMATIRQDQCTQCGQCSDVCRFDAIDIQNNRFTVNTLKCEGCKVCVALCPSGAIDFEPNHCGNWYLSHTRFGPMVHAQLFPAEENSGRLVAELRKQARLLAAKLGIDLILSDGPPGIGCPVISALSATDAAIIVTEPTPSGRHDLERTVELCRHFSIQTAVIINKNNLAQKISDTIIEYCRTSDIPVIASLPHDLVFTEAMVHGQTVTEYSDDTLTATLKDAWQAILDLAVKRQSERAAMNIDQNQEQQTPI
jgi:MinD superfamily P-loop ATPase